MTNTVVIFGQPNVGKSSLFNRLVRRSNAIVSNEPGVTRDIREGMGAIDSFNFKLVDTPGMEDTKDTLANQMRKNTLDCLSTADVIFFIIDGRLGINATDQYIANFIRQLSTSVILIANKCEGQIHETIMYEAFRLGFGKPIMFSAEHGKGIDELHAALITHFDCDNTSVDITKNNNNSPYIQTPAESFNFASRAELQDKAETSVQAIQLAIVGRPNVGKSSLINQLLGKDRMLTGPEAGITRDAISLNWTWGKHQVVLVDTAGMRRKSKVTEKIEALSVRDAKKAIRFSQVVALVIDCNIGIQKQDLTIAKLIVDEGRALVIVVNKWDQVRSPKNVLTLLHDRLESSMPQVRGVPIITLSAITGSGTANLMPAVCKIFEAWDTRISTAELNRWLESMTKTHPPPAIYGRRIKLRYITQPKTRPPTFSIFSSRADKLPITYQRYLINGLRQRFQIKGTPIRINMRKGSNPYVNS